jgi:hypothetical protein
VADLTCYYTLDEAPEVVPPAFVLVTAMPDPQDPDLVMHPQRGEWHEAEHRFEWEIPEGSTLRVWVGGEYGVNLEAVLEDDDPTELTSIATEPETVVIWPPIYQKKLEPVAEGTVYVGDGEDVTGLDVETGKMLASTSRAPTIVEWKEIPTGGSGGNSYFPSGWL